MSTDQKAKPGSLQPVVGRRRSPVSEYELTNSTASQTGRRMLMTADAAKSKNRDFKENGWPDRWRAV